jgi:uncharacterized protein
VRRLVVGAAAFLALASLAFAAPTFPQLTGRVVDNANVLSPSVEADLAARLEALEGATSRQLVVVTLPSLQGYEIEDYGYQLGRAWGIGQREEDNGVLFIVAPNERRVRIEVGYGLEDVLTDALSSVILHDQVLPRFRDGDIEGGVVAGANAIIEQLSLDADAAQARVQAAKRDNGADGSWIFFIVFAVLILFLLGAFGSRYDRRNGRGPWTGGWGGGGWGGGSGGGWGGGGGGGFSGGGGGFGGGGASGGW